MNIKQLDEVRHWIVDNIMRNADIMLLSDEIRNDKIDLVEVIASLYELLHREVTGHPYNYMFHWANKCGAWLENDNIFADVIERVKDND